jgi:hypothetical protein|uniref:Uncharacterized protein n=1 Tax=viral metagenome TaxID=1070528 RepID=A0A6C0LNX1_9ZZZZ
MSGSLNSSNYEMINNEICDLLNTGMYSSVAINIYSNAICTTIAQDEEGNDLSNKVILNVSKISAHKDENGNDINDKITFTFNDNSTLILDDELDNYWYILTGIQMKFTKF